MIIFLRVFQVMRLSYKKLQQYSNRNSFEIIFASLLYARVAKLVDALCSGRSVRKDVLVRIQSRALNDT
jgi:hypothetical protein